MDEQKKDEREAKQTVKDGWKKMTVPVLVLLGLLIAGGGAWYFVEQSKYIYTDKALISAPLINLTPSAPGILKTVFVKEGDALRAHEPVARVGNELIYSEVPGLAVKVKQDIGATYNPGQAVVTMIQPDQLRVEAQIQEDKGLNDIHTGAGVNFTVDAYGSRQFQGTVEEVSPTSQAGDIVFNISDKREEQNYKIKIVYDRAANPPFQNGMSAKVWIIK